MGFIVDGNHTVRPRVSVVIPMHNAAATIDRTLLSVRNQTERNIEILVVDDGSMDYGPWIVRAAMAEDARIRLLSQANAGVAAARNLGIAHARGDFIAPLDADDLWMPRKIERQLEGFARSGEDTAFVYCYFDAIDARDRLLWHGPTDCIEGSAFAALLTKDVVGNGSNALMRTDLVRRVGGYDAELRRAGGQGAEDWQIALRLAELGSVACVPEVLVGYRRTRGNMSGNSMQMLRSARLVADPFRREHPDLVPLIDAHIADRRRWLMARAIAELNLRGVAAMARDIGSRRKLAGLVASVALPVARQMGSEATHALRLRRRSRFGSLSAEPVVGEQFADVALGGDRVAQPVSEYPKGNTGKS